MELRVFIYFVPPEKDNALWCKTLAGLCEDKQGAWLEGQFEKLGEKPAEELGRLMDDCEQNYETVTFEGFEQQGQQLKVIMIGGYGVIDCLSRVESLLICCDVSDLKIEPEEQY